MARIQMQRHQLLNWIDEMKAMGGTALEMLLRSRIDHFYHANKVMIEDSQGQRDALFSKYLVIEDGKIKTEKTEDDVRVVLKNPLERLIYEEKLSKFMMQVVDVEI